MSQWKKHLYPLLMLVAALLLDGVLSAQLKGVLKTDIGIIVPHLTLIVLLILTFYLSFRHIIVLALVIGFMYDSYYSGILGIYMTAFTALVYILLQCRKALPANFMIYTLLSIIVITILEFFIFGVYRAINMTTLTIQEFMVERLGVTILFNSLVMLVLSIPISKLTQKIVQKEEIRFK